MSKDTPVKQVLDVAESVIDKLDQFLPTDEAMIDVRSTSEPKAMIDVRSTSDIDTDQVIRIMEVVAEGVTEYSYEWDRARLIKEIVRAIRG